MILCPKCKREFKNLLALNGHKRVCLYSYNNKINFENGRGKYNKEKYLERILNYEKYPKKCKNCDCNLTYKNRRNTFCNKNCSAKYNNSHKTFGTRRSKLEVWLEDKLKKSYPNLIFKFNSKEAINSELDIFIPELNLAFELNGIFHYEPIFGEKLLNRTQINDQNKFQLCFLHKIELCIIDTSQQIYFKEQSSYKYLDIITEIINSKLQTFGHQSVCK